WSVDPDLASWVHAVSDVDLPSGIHGNALRILQSVRKAARDHGNRRRVSRRACSIDGDAYVVPVRALVRDVGPAPSVHGDARWEDEARVATHDRADRGNVAGCARSIDGDAVRPVSHVEVARGVQGEPVRIVQTSVGAGERAEGGR